jgi:radical SAM superfamily enzyme YgiQ (UPF0313 family)
MRDHLRATTGQPFMPQLTLPYLAALGQRYNEAHGTDHRFELIDDRLDRIRLRGYDMVWFTAVSPTAPAVYRLSDRARAAGMTTVIGGIHATMLPDEVELHADAVVMGEGETTVAEILADWDRDRRLRPRYTGGHDASLDRLPVPRWRDALLADYCPWIIPVQTSRGCRNACHFCSTTRYQGARRRHRPVQEVVDEILRLRDEGVLTPEKVIFFTDNNIVSDTDHRRGVTDTAYARELFRALESLEVLWTGQGEINVADDLELTQLMARAGCINLLVGFESIQQDNLATVGKPSNTVETYIRQIETLHRHGIAIIGCFIFGLDHDDHDVFDHTARFIERYIEVPQISLLTPFPGTPLHHRMAREGRLLHKDWSQYDITHVVFRPTNMTPEELELGYRQLSRRLFSWPAILSRSLRYALRPAQVHQSGFGRTSRFTSVLAPNLVYGSLCRIGRDRPGNDLSYEQVPEWQAR